MGMITVSNIQGAVQEELWDRYVAVKQTATGYHLAAWRHVVARAFSHQTFYLMANEISGEVRGILPLVYLNSPLFGRFLVSLPYFNYGGLVADTAEAADALLTEAAACARSLGADHIELRHVAGLHLDWPKKEHKVSMRMDLPQRYEDLMKAFSTKLRSQVRRGEKEGMTAEVGGLNLLDDFYHVFARNMRDLGTPVYGKQFFAEVLREFPRDVRICAVKFKGQTVASGLVYGYRNMLEIPWASSDKRYGRFAPNMMLYGTALRYACEQGYRVFDFGRSSRYSGTYRFKEQWGAKPVQLEWHYWLRSGHELPEVNPQNPKYRLAIELWKRLPIPVTTLIGPQISRYLP
jgi:FemAB-related protein (PEP-CTERM system-associated)